MLRLELFPEQRVILHSGDFVCRLRLFLFVCRLRLSCEQDAENADKHHRDKDESDEYQDPLDFVRFLMAGKVGIGKILEIVKVVIAKIIFVLTHVYLPKKFENCGSYRLFHRYKPQKATLFSSPLP